MSFPYQKKVGEEDHRIIYIQVNSNWDAQTGDAIITSIPYKECNDVRPLGFSVFISILCRPLPSLGKKRDVSKIC